MKNDGKPAIEETPNVEQLNKETENKSKPSIETIIGNDDKNKEELNLQPGDNDEQTKDEESTSTLSFKNKHNRDNENMMHIEINIKGVKKNQITKKTKEKMKIRGMIRPKKVRVTREILEMTSCLLYTSRCV